MFNKNTSFLLFVSFFFLFLGKYLGSFTLSTCFFVLVYLMLLLLSYLVLMLQVVKQRIQTGQFTSAPNVVRTIFAKEGFKGLYTVWRFIIFKIFFYESTHTYIICSYINSITKSSIHQKHGIYYYEKYYKTPTNGSYFILVALVLNLYI